MTAALSWVPGAHVDICASRGFNVIQFCIWQLVLWDVLRFLHPDLLGVLRTLGFYINFRQLAINGHQCCVLAHASPQGVLKHALGRKCSLMATPSKRDSVNVQSSFEIRSVD